MPVDHNPEAPVAPDAGEVGPQLETHCAVCGVAVSATRRRCPRCFTDLRQVRTLSTEPAAGLSLASRSRRTVEAAFAFYTWRHLLVLALVLWLVWIFVPGWLPRSPLPAPLSTASSDGPPSAWGSVHGDPAASRVTSASAHLNAPVAWLAETGAPPSAPAVVDPRILFVPLEDKRLVAVDLADGSVEWSVLYQYAVQAAPAVAAGRLFVPLRTGGVQALDVNDGHVVWETAIDAGFAAPLIVADGAVYSLYALGSEAEGWSGRLVELDAQTGHRLWETQVATALPLIAPAADPEHLAVTAGRELEIFDRRTGVRTYWIGTSRALGVSLGGSVAYVVAPTYAVAVDKHSSRPWWEGIRRPWRTLNFLDLAPDVPDPPLLWLTRYTGEEALAPVIGSDAVFVANRHDGVLALARGDGSVFWQASLDAITGPPTLTADGLLLPHGSSITLIDPRTGAFVSTRSLDEVQFGDVIVQAIVTDAATFLITATGTIVALADQLHPANDLTKGGSIERDRDRGGPGDRQRHR